MSPGKILIILGGLILVIGILVQVGVPIGRLPGDLRVTRGNFTFYSPLVTGLLVSLALTILLNVLLRR
ncbi:MAG: DUF2905 domain-containing protein [Candidatus Dormibacteria bacterium]